MEDDVKWKATFDGRPSLMEDNVCWETTFVGDVLRCEVIFSQSVTLLIFN